MEIAGDQVAGSKTRGVGRRSSLLLFFLPRLPLHRSQPGRPVVTKRQNGGHQSDGNFGEGNSPNMWN